MLNRFILFLFFSYIYIVICDEKIIPDPKVYYKSRLRGVYNEQKNIAIHTIVHNEFEWIYSSILEKAKIKSDDNELQVSILCSPEFSIIYNKKYIYSNIDRASLLYKKCWNYENIAHNGIIVTTFYSYNKIYKLINDQLVLNVVDKLKQTFPDSNITKIDDECCNHYSILW